MDEEIKEEVLDSPLVVHKKDDASYQETAEPSMQTTHIDEDGDAPTLERHRFKKVKKKKKWPYFLAALVVIVIVVLAVLFARGVIKLPSADSSQTTAKSYTTQEANQFENTITVKGTYIFYEGVEVDGISGLEREIKYQDKGRKFTVQDEHADSNFLNLEVLSLLTDYGMEYEVEHIQSSGLVSKYEVTTAATDTAAETTAAADTTAAPAQ